MMDILMLVAGAGVGAMLRDLFALHRGDVIKERQQLESKTPYDYALTGAINERDRLQDELSTIQALKRTEAATERIRNEIDTILSDGREEASESVYERNIGMPILPQAGELDTTPMVATTVSGMEEWADNISKAFARAYGTNVREDDTEDERLTEDDEERSYTKSVRQAFQNRTIVCVMCSKARYLGEITAFNTEHGELTELQVNGIDIRVEAITEIRRGDDIDGETLYRKGDR